MVFGNQGKPCTGDSNENAPTGLHIICLVPIHFVKEMSASRAAPGVVQSLVFIHSGSTTLVELGRLYSYIREAQRWSSWFI